MDPLSIAATVAGLTASGLKLEGELYTFIEAMKGALEDVLLNGEDPDNVVGILSELGCSLRSGTAHSNVLSHHTTKIHSGVAANCLGS